ncbi:MAG: DUF1801 domain-containing protein [Gemmatimonadetes bacterium]|nr:DUF1801 domain-containing protein [Gemmatimonadota bacterium]NNM34232.1 DUF1801 domain-containing protein [Gemmatimonadota bacterium]
MSSLKTQPNDADVGAFIDRIEHEGRREDSRSLVKLMREVTGEEPMMWGDSIVGFGRYSYRYASGREGEWFVTGFSPRKQAMTLYIMSGFKKHDALLGRLGKHSTGRSCLYVKKLSDVDEAVLLELVSASVEHVAGSAEGA